MLELLCRWAFALLVVLPPSGAQLFEPFPAQQPQFLGMQIPQREQRLASQTGSDSISIRLIDEILEIFVPPSKYAPKRTPRDDGVDSSVLPYGLNRLLPATARSTDRRQDAQEDAEGGIVLGANSAGAAERRFRPQPTAQQFQSADGSNNVPWANLARDMLALFRPLEATTPTTTTTTTTTEAPSLLERFMPKLPDLLNPFGIGKQSTTSAPATAPPLFPFFARATTTSAPINPLLALFRPPEQPKRVVASNNVLVEPLSQLFGVEKKAVEEGRAQIDTGGNAFDRFVVREKVDSENPFAAIVGAGKWNERGIRWEDGNIRLVNKNGNSLLGQSEFSVHDRSVDIPVQRWLDLANNLASSYQGRQESVRRW